MDLDQVIEFLPAQIKMLTDGTAYIFTLLFHRVVDQVLYHRYTAPAARSCFGAFLYPIRIFTVPIDHRITDLRFGHPLTAADQGTIGQGLQARRSRFALPLLTHQEQLRMLRQRHAVVDHLQEHIVTCCLPHQYPPEQARTVGTDVQPFIDPFVTVL
ncbi:hypothetical protein D3C81_1089640 [compost metagenome]